MVVPQDPTNEVPETVPRSPTIPSTFGQEVGATFDSAFDNNITSTVGNFATSQAIQHLDPGPFVPASNIPQALQHRFPNGGSQHEINFELHNQAAETQRQDILAAAPQRGKLANWSLDGVGFAGSMLDPTGLAVGGGLGKIGELGISKLAAPAFNLAKTGTKVTRFIAGAGEGLAFSGIANTASYYNQKQEGFDPTLHILQGALWPTLIGAGIHSLVGRTPGIENEEAQQVAGSQLDNGNLVNAHPVLQQAIFDKMGAFKSEMANYGADAKYAAKANLTYPWGEDLTLDRTPQYNDQGYETFNEDTLQHYSDQLGSKLADVKAKLDALPEVPDTTVNTLDRTWDTLKKPATEWSDQELNQVNKIQDMPHMRDFINAGADNALELSPDQTSILDNLYNKPNYESDVLKDSIANHQQQIDSINNSLVKKGFDDPYMNESTRAFNPEETNNIEQQQILRDKRLQPELDSMKQRLKDLRANQLHGDDLKVSKQRSKLQLQKNTLENLKGHVDAQHASLSMDPTDVKSLDDIYQQHASGNAQADVADVEQLQPKLTAELESPKMETADHWKDEAQRQVDAGNLSQDAMDKTQDEIDDAQTWYDKLPKMLSDTVQCMLGGAE